MTIEISKEQKEVIAGKIAMCLDFLKSEVQPHLIHKDKIVVDAGDTLELHITDTDICVKEVRVVSFGVDVTLKKTFTLEKDKRNSKKNKNYICESHPEAAIDFLKHWESVKATLMVEVAEKNKEVDKINDFIENFKA